MTTEPHTIEVYIDVAGGGALFMCRIVYEDGSYSDQLLTGAGPNPTAPKTMAEAQVLVTDWLVDERGYEPMEDWSADDPGYWAEHDDGTPFWSFDPQGDTAYAVRRFRATSYATPPPVTGKPRRRSDPR